MLLKNVVAGAGAVAVILCWPLATGQIGQSLYMGAIKNYHSPYMTITNQSFERGYLSSDAVSRIELKDTLKTTFEEEGLPTTWLVKHHIKNGFLGVKSSSELEIDKQVAPLISSIWGENVQPITLVTDSSLTGNTDFTMTINPINYDQSGAFIKSQAFVLTGSANADGAGDFNYTLPSLDVKTDSGETMQVNAFEGKGSGQMQGNFWIGDQTFNLGKANFASADNQHHVELEGMSVMMKNALSQPKDEKSPTEETQQVTNTNNISIKKIVTLDGQQYTDFNFALALKDLNYKAISRLAVMEESTTVEQQQAQMKDAMLALDLLVAKGATVDLSDLSMMTQQGKVNASLLLELKPGLARASENLAALPNILMGNINIVMPKAFVANEPLLVAKVPELLQQKIITEDQDSYKLTVKVEGSQLVFGSGLKIPLAMLSMLMMH
ncbi:MULTISPECIES: DUF945 family protein [unclassified Photobacterium]|uniref:DUF945 family protein n=1 Tax=unclassified Photobacterium TaxID=2628852 RepID=UPI001EDCF8D8|nr:MULTISPECIES: DUF945 family protein [unclassified Photobacterium]MCG3863115.1 DUF945 family protein [Photobacterium sp. Ph6]MCG3874645.1 DUF945 family protein [Photobacterium sp. Ph5]